MVEQTAPEGIHVNAVSAWLSQRIPGLKPPLSFELIAGGHSNLTYRFDDAKGAAYVLRRPPLGHVLESAHDMGREHTIISALQDSGVPVPPALALCRDTTINEAPFYVMKYVPGIVLHSADAAVNLDVRSRHALGLQLVDVLSRLHQISPDAVGLGDLSRKEAYLARQLKRWNKQWAASKTHEVWQMEETAQLLQASLPEQIGVSIVHGDYRLGNMIISDDGETAELQAVLDWELCTLGDPLADVGYLLNNWVQPGEAGADAAPTGIGGFPSRELLCERYTSATGRDLSGVNYYQAFSHWRLAAIGQGVYKRYLAGAMGTNRDIDMDAYKESVRTRAVAALDLLT